MMYSTKQKKLIGSLCLCMVLWTGWVLTGCTGAPVTSRDPGEMLDEAVPVLSSALEELNDTTVSPRSYDGRRIRFVSSRDWTSGFFPGMLWMMYEYTGDPQWKAEAHHYTMNLEREQYNATTHDMGFKLGCSFGQGFRLTSDPAYERVLLQGTKTLITRYNPVVGSIRSWDHNSDKWDYPVIIDNMMNLELLFWATRATGDSTYYRIAVSHAETTMEDHYRDDYSSYHVISYDTLTGQVAKRETHQGYADGSAWARGQAWGLYGFTMAYRETGDQRYLDQAVHIAEYLLDHPRLPEDGIPYWDFDVPGGSVVQRDVSAAAIMASALTELAVYHPGEKEKYLATADDILATLHDNYRLEGVEGVPFLLDQSVGNYNREEEIGVPIIYADYYYMEALLRRWRSMHGSEGTAFR